ncbi:hypothetical protein JW879_03625 [candidate division WOR-3 bacterium]|nr:hypothetical protein [candidate division WOR-3 bacterium]
MGKKKETFEPLHAIGLFWIFFGIIISVGIFVSKTGLGKATNGICGAILFFSGVGAFLKGTYNKRKSPKG